MTQADGPSFGPVSQRIAVLDNDGRLWPKYPLPFPLAYAMDEVKRLVAENPSIELTYQPMQELLRYLRANGFKTFIVSGGGADFMDAETEWLYLTDSENRVVLRCAKMN